MPNFKGGKEANLGGGVLFISEKGNRSGLSAIVYRLMS